ncbi:MAG: VWA domain-containing protein [Bacteroidales bacterium]|nr:VWA domain-containing protein [Bacteroidales bacterium]MCF8386556.1 VWA domain-containing protein [Bacteroidales bacterium]MCF8397769.1 VWA domain-containing protein [Bacteroidales bacterium]
MKNFIQTHLLLIAIIAGFQAFSQQGETNEDKVLSPYFLVKSDDPDTDRLPLKHTSAEVNIAGMIADVTIHQVYANEGKNALEAIYTFPASANAAVYAMEMKVGERIIRAKIEEKQKAREDYEKAKNQGKRTSLLEQSRPNVFQMNVANIMPGDAIKVSLRYTEMLVPEKGIYSFVYPTVVGPRYSTEKQNDDNQNSYINTPYLHEGEDATYDFDIEVFLNAGMPIQNIDCKSHEVVTHYPALDQVKINLDPTENKGGNRDFVLEYQLAGEEISSGMMLYEHEDENFFLMMVQPPKRIENEDIPPREYIFINDVSGSMNGYPMDVSKKIMRNLVSNLRPVDRFNVLVFAGNSGWWSDQSRPATRENISKAINFIDYQRGSGGTEILHALRKAMSFPREFEELSRTFVIFTDGYISVEKEAFDLIRNNSDLANTFVFGIGSSVNRYLIEGMAHVGMGEPFIVLNKEETNEKAERFREYISNPVLTQIKMDASGFDVYDVEPFSIPDVFAERPIIIFGKYRGKPEGSITLKGYSGRKRWKTRIDVSESKADEKNVALRYLWSRKRIQLIDDYARVDHQNDTKEETTQLGLKYNLLTKYTSFIAIEEARTNDGEIKTVKQALPLPQNVSDYAVGFEMAMCKISPRKIILYRQVHVITSMDAARKIKIRKQIENKYMASLNNCLMMPHDIESFTITVNQDGKVAGVTFKGGIKAKAVRKCIREIVSKWNFSNFSSAGGFELQVKL